MKHNNAKQRLELSKFRPLIAIFSIIIAFTLARQIYYGWNLVLAMNDAMGSFFLIFGSFKLMNWEAFVEAYQMYDILAQKSKIYAYAYPLIELTLGILYILQVKSIILNIFTLILMLISALGVLKALYRKEQITCACLGAIFKIPMTYVTLFEDLAMAIMALILLILLR